MEIDDEPQIGQIIVNSKKSENFSKIEIVHRNIIFGESAKSRLEPMNTVLNGQRLPNDFLQRIVLNKSAEERHSDQQTFPFETILNSSQDETSLLEKSKNDFQNIFDVSTFGNDEHASTICRHLSEIEGKNDGDVKIVCRDGETIFAHRF